MRTLAYACLVLSTSVALVGSGAAQSILSTTVGTGVDQFLGASVAPIGDLDGDGVPEILVGAPENPNTGEYPSFIFTPPASTAPTFGRVAILSGASGAVMSTIVGPYLGESFGRAVLSPGDLNGDGIPDLVIGAPTAPFDGRVHVISGQASVPLYSPLSPALVTGGACVGISSMNGLFGQSLAAVGDVNGDGVADFAVGAPSDGFAPWTQPQCQVQSGANGSNLLTVCGATVGLPIGLGFDVVGGMDLNGDGVPDFAATAPAEARVQSFSGADGTQINTKQVFDGFFGFALAWIPDQDGDALDDLAVGAPNSSMGVPFGGRVIILSSATLAILGNLVGTGTEDQLGIALDSGGDFDGDGIRDLAVGARRAGSPAALGVPGFVEVYSGATLHLLARITSPVAGNGFGWSVAFVGDLNGDGADELAVGAPLHSTTTLPRAGAVYLVSGLTTPACAVGGVGLPSSGPEAVLTLNGSPGPGAHRVPVGIGQPFSIEMAQPSTLSVPAKFSLFGAVGLPSSASAYPSAFGNFCIVPQPAAPSNPLLFHLADGFGFGNPLITTSPAPWAVGVPSGLPFPGFITFQGVVEHIPGIPPGNLAITNAVILDVQ